MSNRFIQTIFGPQRNQHFERHCVRLLWWPWTYGQTVKFVYVNYQNYFNNPTLSMPCSLCHKGPRRAITKPKGDDVFFFILFLWRYDTKTLAASLALWEGNLPVIDRFHHTGTVMWSSDEFPFPLASTIYRINSWVASNVGHYDMCLITVNMFSNIMTTMIETPEAVVEPMSPPVILFICFIQIRSMWFICPREITIWQYGTRIHPRLS